MAHTATMTLQRIWNCRWSRPGYRPNGVAETKQPDGFWVCVRPTRGVVRRPVTEDECATCPHWQAAFPDES